MSQTPLEVRLKGYDLAIKLSHDGHDPIAALDREDRAGETVATEGAGIAAVSLSAIRFDNELIERDGNNLLAMCIARQYTEDASKVCCR